MKTALKTLTVFSFAAALAACGGGGGGGDSGTTSSTSTSGSTGSNSGSTGSNSGSTGSNSGSTGSNSGSTGSTTTTPTVTAPTITTQPVSVAMKSGDSGTLSVVASGTSLTYQWYKDQVAVSGGTSSSLTVTAAGSYYVVVTNSAGSVTSSTVNVAITTSDTSSSTALQTSVPAATYASGSNEAVAFALVNSERNKCGFGLVAQNTKLDTAAAAHAEYVRLRLLEGVFATHTEDSTKTGYYAAGIGGRVLLAGYNYSEVSENFNYLNLTFTGNFGEGLVRNMFASVYHLASMLNGNKEAGVSIKTDASAAPSGYQYAVMDWTNGIQQSSVKQQTTDLVSYPCDGTTGIQPYMGGKESPEPFTNLGLTSGQSIGHPIYIKAPDGTKLTLTSAAINSSTSSVTVALMNSTDDPEAELTVNEAFVIPTKPLAGNTKYTVTVTGTMNNAAFTKTFSFTTGAY